MSKRVGEQWDWTALRPWEAVVRPWEVVVPTVLIVACLLANAFSASTVWWVLLTAALVAYVYCGAQRLISAKAIGLLTAVSLAVGVVVFAVSGGDWSAASTAVCVVTVVPAVWFFALSVQDSSITLHTWRFGE